MKVLVLTSKNGLVEENLDDNNTLKALQNKVDGFIEVIPYLPEKLLLEDIVLLGNEDSKMRSDMDLTLVFKDPNIDDYLLGTLVFVGSASDNFVSLNDKQINLIRESIEEAGYAMNEYKEGIYPFYTFKS